MANVLRPTFLPYGRQLIDSADMDAVSTALESDYLTTGPLIEEFERALSQSVDSKDAIACSSGTAALHLAAMALRIGPGDQVIVPTVTFLATANAVRYVGADVIFADVNPDTGAMGPPQFLEALNQCRNPAAVFPVHLGGPVEGMPEIAEIARRNGVRVVEDACHALGGEGCGSSGLIGSCAYSDMTVFSFHAVKMIAMGEGGAITTNDESLTERLKKLRNSGMASGSEIFRNPELAFDSDGADNPWYYEMQELGYNYRASDIHCALGLAQLSKLSSFADRRRNLVGAYDKRLKTLAPIVIPARRSDTERGGWHLYRVLVDFEKAGVSRRELMNQLSTRNIGTQVHYIPVHLQPYYTQLYGNTNLPGAMEYYNKCLSLPLHVQMDVSDVDYVIDSLADALGLEAARTL